MIATFSPWDAEHRSNPHRLCRQMRSEAPVYPAVGPVTGRTFWFLAAHDDAVAALRHRAIGKEIDEHISEAILEAPDGGFDDELEWNQTRFLRGMKAYPTL